MVSGSERDELVRRIGDLAQRAKDPEYLVRFNSESTQYKLAQLGRVDGVSQEELDELGRDLARHFGLDPGGRMYVRSSLQDRARGEPETFRAG